MLRKLPRFALVLAILLVLWFAVAMFGAKFGIIDKLFAFGTMTAAWGSMMAMGLAVIAVIALLVALLVKPRSGWLAALIALIIPLAVLGGFNQLREQAGSVPFIYDITTNTADAPMYSDALVKARTDSGENVNPLLDFNSPLGTYEKWAENEELAAKTAAQLISEGYPDLKTLIVAQSPDNALKAVKEAMEMRGFENVTADEKAGTVEGTAVVFWYGFEDDIVARIRPADSGASIDFRSTSRVGTSDLGVNAERIADLSAAVSDRLASQSPEIEVAVPKEEAVAPTPTPAPATEPESE
ncbi:DUF1499 domain-containing protein [Pontixanthobacter gangjinensis]|uniref:DUF1499 domain-containing protein n=1 Tax=Pontixanthobacter gangjinensis TaxID=1028742 RepID=A0A6I4SPI9_9SPHN|nr:DUF1499 domain-containing protein [Pontixanthobacter gangjinensis]MXO56592.1 DUF1499 domain-containing protein [Pontixanthobacter gangjinensis]